MNKSKIIPGFSNYTINPNGIVFNTTTNELVESFRDKRSNTNICLKRDDGVFQSISVMNLIGRLFVMRPGVNLNDVRIFIPRDGNFDNLSLTNIVPIYNRYIAPVIEDNKWYTIPSFSLYAINNDGEVKFKQHDTLITPKTGVFDLIPDRRIKYKHPPLTSSYLQGITFGNHYGNLEEIAVVDGKIYPECLVKNQVIRIAAYKNIKASEAKDKRKAIYFNTETHASCYFNVPRRTILRRLQTGTPVTYTDPIFHTEKQYILSVYE